MGFSDRISRCNAAVMARFAEHTAVVAPGESAPVIYDEAFRLAEAYEGQVETSAPACSMDSPEVARLAIAHGTRLEIYKKQSLVGSFEVIGIEPDGCEMTRLVLTKDT